MEGDRPGRRQSGGGRGSSRLIMFVSRFLLSFLAYEHVISQTEQGIMDGAKGKLLLVKVVVRVWGGWVGKVGRGSVVHDYVALRVGADVGGS